MAKAYKLVRIKDLDRTNITEVYPLYIYADEPMPIGKWIDAKVGEKIDDKHVKAKGCGGSLSLRPGLHFAPLPYGPWIGKKLPDGTLGRRRDTVWCECEYSDEIDYQDVVNKNGINKKGVLIPRNAMMREIPVNGFYRYKCNTQGDEWIIAGSGKITRVLSEYEVERICFEHGIEAQRFA